MRIAGRYREMGRQGLTNVPRGGTFPNTMEHPLRKLRTDLKLSLRGFADEIGASKSKVFRIEKRQQDADLEMLRQVEALARRRGATIRMDDFLSLRPMRAAG